MTQPEPQPGVMGAIPGLLGSAGCCAFALVVAPAYSQMFLDFDCPLPALTKLMLATWPPVALAASSFALVLLAAHRRSSRLFRAAALVGIGGFICCMVAMWIPDINQLPAHRDF